jgi:hypothetical protein
MLALQHETGLGGVIKILSIQRYERESLAVMLHMTADAVRLAWRTPVSTRVIAGVRLQPVLNLHVAF